MRLSVIADNWMYCCERATSLQDAGLVSISCGKRNRPPESGGLILFVEPTSGFEPLTYALRVYPVVRNAWEQAVITAGHSVNRWHILTWLAPAVFPFLSHGRNTTASGCFHQGLEAKSRAV